MKSKYKFRHCIGVSNDIAFAPQAAANRIKNELFGKISRGFFLFNQSQTYDDSAKNEKVDREGKKDS